MSAAGQRGGVEVPFVMLLRTDETARLRRDHGAFALLAEVALRCRWHGVELGDGLQAGQSFVGNWRELGFPTEKAYRTAKLRLQRLGLAKFKGTPKGTVATLGPPAVFEVMGYHFTTADAGKVQERPAPAPQPQQPARSAPPPAPVVEPRQHFAAILAGKFAALNKAEIKELYGRWATYRQQIGKALTAAEVERDVADLALVSGVEGFGLAAVQREMDKAMRSGCWPVWSAGVKAEIEAQRREVEEQKRKAEKK